MPQIGKFDPINFSYRTSGNRDEAQLSNTINELIKQKIKTMIKDKKPSTLSDKLEVLEQVVISELSNQEEHIDSIPGDTRFPANFTSLKNHCSYVAGVSTLFGMVILEEYILKNYEQRKDTLTKKHIMECCDQDFPGISEVCKKILEYNSANPSNSNILSNLSITPKEFILICRISGLMHDVAKPLIQEDHAENSSIRTEKYLELLNVDAPIRTIIREAVASHHPRGSSRIITPLQGIITASDYIATSERSAIFNPEIFGLILNASQDLNTLFDAQNKTDFLNMTIKIYQKNTNAPASGGRL
jgi:hypothetical protein